MSDLLDILSDRVPATARATLVLDKTVRARIHELEAALIETRRADEDANRVPQARAIAEQILELRNSVRTITFTFAELPHVVWERLVAAHPPRPEDKAAGAEWNVSSFPPALFAASCVGWSTSDGRSGDGMTVEEAAAWWGDSESGNAPGFADSRTLWQTALAAQSDAGDIPKAEIATAYLRSSEPKSTTAPPEESLTASS